MSQSRHSVLFALTVVLVLIPFEAFTQLSFDSVALAKIKPRMEGLVAHGKISGAVMILAQSGKVILHEGVGYKDIEAKEPIKLNTIFQVQSMTKPITAVATMKLIENGLIRLNDPIDNYLAEYKQDEHLSNPITIRHLLTHTSGMPHGKHYPYSDMPSETTLQEIVKSHSEQPLETAPGTNFQYSSQGIEVLGLIIERVTGMPYENFVAEHILEPLGMTDSFFRPTSEQCSRVAAVYQMGEDGLVPLEEDPCRPYTYPNPAGGLFSTAKDMLVFYEMMQQGGTYMNARILSAESVRAMTTPNISVPSGGLFSAFGLGFWVVGQEIDTQNLPLQSLGSFGHAGYFGTIGWANPEKELIGVFLVSYDPNIDSNRHLYVREAAEIFIAMATSAIQE